MFIWKQSLVISHEVSKTCLAHGKKNIYHVKKSTFFPETIKHFSIFLNPHSGYYASNKEYPCASYWNNILKLFRSFCLHAMARELRVHISQKEPFTDAFWTGLNCETPAPLSRCRTNYGAPFGVRLSWGFTWSFSISIWLLSVSYQASLTLSPGFSGSSSLTNHSEANLCLTVSFWSPNLRHW